MFELFPLVLTRTGRRSGQFTPRELHSFFPGPSGGPYLPSRVAFPKSLSPIGRSESFPPRCLRFFIFVQDALPLYHFVFFGFLPCTGRQPRNSDLLASSHCSLSGLGCASHQRFWSPFTNVVSFFFPSPTSFLIFLLPASTRCLLLFRILPFHSLRQTAPVMRVSCMLFLFKSGVTFRGPPAPLPFWRSPFAVLTFVFFQFMRMVVLGLCFSLTIPLIHSPTLKVWNFQGSAQVPGWCACVFPVFFFPVPQTPLFLFRRRLPISVRRAETITALFASYDPSFPRILSPFVSRFASRSSFSFSPFSLG